MNRLKLYIPKWGTVAGALTAGAMYVLAHEAEIGSLPHGWGTKLAGAARGVLLVLGLLTAMYGTAPHASAVTVQSAKVDATEP
jgi:hypothetical protein